MKTRVMASAFKILAHGPRVERFLAGEPIHPVTLELGLTSRCNRACRDCPSRLGTGCDLPCDLVEPLFSSLAGHTPGLIITGGEPTMHPRFPWILERARTVGRFAEISVLTNGSRLDDLVVARAIANHASAVRISLYDWQDGDFAAVDATLASIARLRLLVAHDRLSIGISVLTSNDSTPLLPDLCDRARAAGVDWCYFHPTCTADIDDGTHRSPQAAALAAIERLGTRCGPDFEIFFHDGRYAPDAVEFRAYHTAHFIWVVGADGRLYLSSEAKYRPEYLLGDLAHGCDGLVFDDTRRHRIDGVDSANYRLAGSRNRGILYNGLLDSILADRRELPRQLSRLRDVEFVMPSIL